MKRYRTITSSRRAVTAFGTKRQRLGLMGDLLGSGALTGLGALVNFASVLLFARVLHPAEFGLLASCRRVVAFLAPITNLSGHLAVSRYLGYWTAEPARRSACFAIGVALLVLIIPVTAVLLVLVRISGHAMQWLGSVDPAVWLATAGLAGATGVGLVTFSMLRGLGHPHAANLHQLLCFISLAGIAAIAAGRPVAQLLTFATVTAFTVSAGHLLWVVHRHRSEWRRPSLAQLRAAARDITRYSLPRLADGPSQAALPLIGVLLAPALGGMALAGHLHIGQTVVRMLEIVIVPLSVIFLPLVARQVREGKLAELQRQAQLIFDAVLLLGLHLEMQALAWSSILLHATFGEKYSGAAPLLLFTLPSIVPNLLYAGFRGFIDGFSEKPINFLNLLIANAIVLAASWPLGSRWGGSGLALGYTIGICVLGLLSLRFVRRQFHVRIRSRATVTSLVLASLLGSLSGLVAFWARSRGAVVAIAIFVVVQAVAVAALLWAAYKAEHPAVRYAVARFRPAADNLRAVASDPSLLQEERRDPSPGPEAVLVSDALEPKGVHS